MLEQVSLGIEVLARVALAQYVRDGSGRIGSIAVWYRPFASGLVNIDGR